MASRRNLTKAAQSGKVEVMSNHPLRIAIVGAGPAGCFTAEELLRSGKAMHITIFERLPRPGGLVRFGVAPDHTPTRRLIGLMERTLTNVQLRTGVEVGRDVELSALRREFDAVVIASGAEADRIPPVPGSHLRGVHSARAVAGWLNGHPDFDHEDIALAVKTAVVIGNGNVALDMARLLCLPPDRVQQLDLPPGICDALEHSAIRTIHVVGRRGPAQASFGENELAEVAGLPGIDFRVDPIVTMLSPDDEQELSEPASERARAVVGLLRKMASALPSEGIRRTLSLDFMRRPLGFNGEGAVNSVTLELMKLDGPPGHQTASPTGSLQKLDCGLVILATGQRARPWPGLTCDEKLGFIVSRDHRVERGLYVAGWAGRPASGLIGHNRRDAQAVVEQLLADFTS